MATRMQQRRGTAAQWTAANPTLAAGEIGFETDTNQFKIGNGSSAWSALSYFKNLDGLDGVGGIVTLNANGMIDINLIPQGVALDAELSQYVDDHNAETENVHGISNTANLVYQDDLSGAISTEVTNRNNAITNAITDEGTARNTAIDDAIVLEVANRNTAINDAITLEVTNRDAAIDDAIADEVTARNTAIDDAIANEVTLRDAAIDDAIADEVTARNAAITADIGTHNSDTSNVHGILDTTLLATDSDVSAAQTAAEGYADSAISAHNLDQTNVHGIANTANLVLTDDARLSDERTPVDGSVTTAKIATGGIAQSAVTNLTTDLAAKATLVSPALTGTPTAPTATLGTNTTQIATTAFVKAEVDALVAAAPGALNTLDELAAALGDDANFASTVTASLATKASTTDLDNALLYSFNNETASYTLALSDATNMVEMESSSSTTVTVPPNASVAFSIGTTIDIFQKGTGQVTIAEGSGVTIYATPGKKLRTQYSGATLIKRDTNTWILTGDLSA